MPMTHANEGASLRYAKILETSRRVRWEIQRDVMQGRMPDPTRNFLPSGLSLVNELDFLSEDDAQFFSQVQGRTYSYLFGLVERFIVAKVLQVGSERSLDEQQELEALVGMAEEELKHQAMFRHLEQMLEASMPAGYVQTVSSNEVARAVLSKPTWSVLALTLHIELFTLAHYRASIEGQMNLCPLWKDVFLFHWKEESQHAQLDELELLREDARLGVKARDEGVNGLIELVQAVDGILQMQASADASYFLGNCAGKYSAAEQLEIAGKFLKAYRWQYIVSGVQIPKFQQVLFSLLNQQQQQQVLAALAPLMECAPTQVAVSASN